MILGVPFGRAIRYYSSTLLPLRFTNISGVTATIPNPIPFVTDDRNKKIYASTMLNGDSDIEDLTKNIEKISTVSGTDIRAVRYALTYVILNMLTDGKSVKLGKLATSGQVSTAKGKSLLIKLMPTVLKNQKRNCR